MFSWITGPRITNAIEDLQPGTQAAVQRAADAKLTVQIMGTRVPSSMRPRRPRTSSPSRPSSAPFSAPQPQTTRTT